MKQEYIHKIFSKIPTLETERLILRPMRFFDAFDMYAYAKLPEVTEFLTWNPHPDIEYTKNYLGFVIGRYKSGEFYDWAVTLKEAEGKMIGTCGFSRIDAPNEIGEVGYVIAPEYQNNGYATEAVRTLIDFGFDSLRLHRIEARFISGNRASFAVMQKCGMTYEGTGRGAMLIKGSYKDIGTCALLREEYTGR